MTDKLTKFFDTEIDLKGVNDKDRTVWVNATVEKTDRDNELVKVDGIDINQFVKQGVILWGHNHYSYPVGKPVDAKKTKNSVKIKVQFATMEENAEADTVYRLVKGGYIKSVSIGFIPDYKSIELGTDPKQPYRTFKKIDMVELSFVNVPSNPNATIDNAYADAISKGVVDELEVKALFLPADNKNVNTDTTTITDTDIEPEPTEEKTMDYINKLETTIKELTDRVDHLEQIAQQLKDDNDKNIYDDLFNSDDQTDTDSQGEKPNGKSIDVKSMTDAEILDALKKLLLEVN